MGIAETVVGGIIVVVFIVCFFGWPFGGGRDE